MEIIEVIQIVKDGGLIALFALNTFVLWQVYQTCIKARVADLKENAGMKKEPVE